VKINVTGKPQLASQTPLYFNNEGVGGLSVLPNK
jgi:hypothetical protein